MPYATGERLEASDLNLKACKYRSIATQTLTSGVAAKITLATQLFNFGGVITMGGSNTLTLTRAGLYAIGGGLQGNNWAGDTYIWVGDGASMTAANRFAIGTDWFTGGKNKAITVATEHYFAANATLSLWAYHSTGANRDTHVAAELLPYLYARFLGDG